MNHVDVARIAYEANRVYSVAIGENPTLSWDAV